MNTGNIFYFLSAVLCVRIGKELGVDYSLTWTCYKGQELACGKCGSCIERLEAFNKNNLIDPIKYE